MSSTASNNKLTVGSLSALLATLTMNKVTSSNDEVQFSKTNTVRIGNTIVLKVTENSQIVEVNKLSNSSVYRLVYIYDCENSMLIKV